MRTLTPAQARRIAIAAQGLADPRPSGRVDARHVRRVFAAVGFVQIDSVNVVARAHELALYSRLGPYPAGLLGRVAYQRREVFEYWAHEASYVPVGHHRLLRHRMRHFSYGPTQRGLAGAPPGYLDDVEAEIAERGPLAASELADAGARSGPWWGWSPGKAACEALLARGRLAVACRRGFTRVYDVPERVLPDAALRAPTPDPDDAERQLLLLAARAHGVGTAGDLADYPRLGLPRARRLLDQLAAERLLERVEVRGWSEPAFLHPEARMPRRVQARALLSPFDSLVWCRPRVRRLFGFGYRLEIYVPAHRRVHGYYVLPFLLGDRLVARVDLKADRTRQRLLVRAAWAEDGVEVLTVAGALAAELSELAWWLGVGTIDVGDAGDLAPALSAAVGATPTPLPATRPASKPGTAP